MKGYSLVGVDGNAFSIIRYVMTAMRREGCSDEEIKEYQTDATSSNYHHLVAVSDDMIHKLNNKEGK